MDAIRVDWDGLFRCTVAEQGWCLDLQTGKLIRRDDCPNGATAKVNQPMGDGDRYLPVPDFGKKIRAQATQDEEMAVASGDTELLREVADRAPLPLPEGQAPGFYKDVDDNGEEGWYFSVGPDEDWLKEQNTAFQKWVAGVAEARQLLPAPEGFPNVAQRLGLGFTNRAADRIGRDWIEAAKPPVRIDFLENDERVAVWDPEAGGWVDL